MVPGASGECLEALTVLRAVVGSFTSFRMTELWRVLSRELLSFHRFACEEHLGSPVLCKIGPSRVSGLDQGYLFCAGPAFEFFFSSDGPVDVVEALVVN